LTRRRPTAAAVVFALLVLATVAAFAYAQQKKRDPLIIDRVVFARDFAPERPCRSASLRIKLRTTTSNDATIQVVKPGGKLVATLVRGRFLKRYSYHVLHWDGTDRGGAPAPSGNYRLRVKLEDEGRTLVLPGTIRLHRTHAKQKFNCLGVSEPS
jgi:hypothetical protein